MGTDSIIYIRTDGNQKIATGHLVRCLCIAEALEKLGKKVCFLVSDETSYELLQDLCKTIFSEFAFFFDIRILKSAAFDNLELELEELCKLLGNNSSSNNANEYVCKESVLMDEYENFQKQDKSILFIDSYYVTPAYFEALKKIAYIAYMDDLRAFDYDVDMVINYDVIPVSKEAEYHQAYTKTKFRLLGAQFTPLRKQFQNQKVTLREHVENVLITTGGSDPYHFTEKISTFLLAQNLDLDIHIVVGRLFDNLDELKALSLKYPGIYLHQNITDMASLMKQCDFAISAAGTTLYELCALGIPAISFTFADNQMIMAKTFDETDAVPYSGDIRDKQTDSISDYVALDNKNTQTDIVCAEILKYLTSILHNHDQRLLQQQMMQHQTDGAGAMKIAKALQNLSLP